MYVLQFLSGGDFILTRDDVRRLIAGEHVRVASARDHSRSIISGDGWQVVCPPFADITALLPTAYQC